jgi:hypothetical protein
MTAPYPAFSVALNADPSVQVRVSVILFMEGSKRLVLAVEEAVCRQGGLFLMGVYSVLFVRKWCFKQANLSAFMEDVLSNHCFWHQFSVIFLHCSYVSILKNLAYV